MNLEMGDCTVVSFQSSFFHILFLELFDFGSDGVNVNTIVLGISVAARRAKTVCYIVIRSFYQSAL